jgi:hypothetical protein
MGLCVHRRSPCKRSYPPPVSATLTDHATVNVASCGAAIERGSQLLSRAERSATLPAIPGISDAHTHVLNESNFTYTVRWDGVPTLRRALAMLSEQAERTPEGQWVKVIGGWSPYQFEENRFPTMDELRRRCRTGP